MSDLEKKFVVRKIKNIAFFGDAAVTPDSEVYKDAYRSAKIMAKEGFTIVNGGGSGVMAASTAGAESVEGETLSVTFNPKNAPGFEGRYIWNVTDREVKTGNYVERMFKLMEHADIYLIFKGGTGTISEFGTAWVLAKLYYGHHKPFILVGDFWRAIIEVFKDNLLIDAQELDVFEIVSDSSDVLLAVRRTQKKIEEVDHTHCKVCQESAFMS